MAKKFYLSDKQNIRILVPEKYRPVFGMYISSGSKSAPVKDGISGAEPGYEEIEADIKKYYEKQDASKKNKKRKNKKREFNMNYLIRCIAFTVMFYSLSVLCDYANGYMKDIEVNNEIVEDYGIYFDEEEKLTTILNTDRTLPKYPGEDEVTDTEQRFYYPKISSMSSIEKLQSDYKDFVFWLYIENTSISYAVVQAEDNDYYLRRNINGEANLSGTLFLDFRNDESMETGNNIVYGHNMQNGTMFGSMKKYEEKDFFDSHQMIYTYTADEVTAWQVFSVYETTTENYYIQTEFIDKNNYYEFITALQRDSIHESDVVLTSDTAILTLTTCHKYNYDNGRFVLHAAKCFTVPIS